MPLPQIAYSIILAALIASGWRPEAAQEIAEEVPAYYDNVSFLWPSFAAYFSLGGYTAFSSTSPARVSVDHEYQHAWYWNVTGRVADGGVSEIERDFRSTVDANDCVAVTVKRHADVEHWPHVVIDCARRNTFWLPQFLREKYYSWVKPKYEVFIPVAEIG